METFLEAIGSVIIGGIALCILALLRRY